MDSIKKSADFQLIAQKGEKWVSDSFIIQIMHREGREEEPCRCGLVVSKKMGNAVRRNFLKRRFRETFRLAMPAGLKGVDVVFIGRQSSIKSDLPKMLKDLQWCLKRLGLNE